MPNDAHKPCVILLYPASPMKLRLMRYIALAVTLLMALPAWSQSNLSKSIQHSPYTYIYKISVKEAEVLALSRLRKVNDKYLHSLVDSFKTQAKIPALAPGNYLLIYALKNNQVIKLHTAGDIDIKLVNNNRRIHVAVHSASGGPIENAKVYSGNKKLSFDNKTKTYGHTRRKRSGLIQVEHNNVLYFFPVAHHKRGRPGLAKRISTSFPLKYVVQPIRNLIYPRQDRYPNYFNESADHEKKFRSFVVFSKPRYKPGDTVKLKAFVQTKSGKHLTRPLIVRLTSYGFDTDTIIATIKPYRAGGYEYQFVLSDSLQEEVDLDNDYLITLETTDSRKYDLDEYEGDLDEDEYAMKRKIVARGKFHYEEYELHEVTFKARSLKASYHRGEEIAVFLKATDENDMPVMDGRIEISVTPADNPEMSFTTARVFVPDTLWTHSQVLDNVGETKIIIPDSAFPKANLGYTVECIFLDAANERRTERLHHTFSDDPHEIVFETKADNLLVTHFISGKPAPAAAQVFFLKENDTLERHTVSLPASIRLNPFATSYVAQTKDITETYNLKWSSGMVNCVAMRTADSVFAQLVNPLKLQVWYTVYAGNKVVLRGYGDSLMYKAKAQTPKGYFIQVQYVYADRVYKDEFAVAYFEKSLTVKLEQPEFVYPGQTTTIGINVSDGRGRPVANADVTAYAYTKKFQPARPTVPYMGKRHSYRKQPTHSLSLREQEDDFTNTSKLNWERWSREMNLTSVEYYKFTHPNGIYINREPAKDRITQIAPFVVLNGELQPIHCLYIYNEPVFFSQSQHLERYSFRADSGWYNLRLRTHNKEVSVDSVFVAKGMKTFISISIDTANLHRKVRVTDMPEELTRHEQELWNRYMILVNDNFGESLSYIRQDDKIYLLNSTRHSSTLTGPLTDYRATLVVKNKFHQDFEPEGGWQYTITKGLIKQKQLRDPLVFSKKLRKDAAEYNFQDFVLTEREVDSLWQDYLDLRSSNTELFQNDRLQKKGNGELIVKIETDGGEQPLFVKNVILFRYSNPDFIRIYTGNSRHLGYQRPGLYRLLFLLKNGRYFIRDSVNVQANGINFYQLQPGSVKLPDQMSSRIDSLIQSRSIYEAKWAWPELDRIKETFNNNYMNDAEFTEMVRGVVYDTKGTPIVGASVQIKGTRVATVTNADGLFSLRAPAQGTLVVNYVGYEGREFSIHAGMDIYRVELRASTNSLSEVIVTGYGIQRKRDMTGSVSTLGMLQGKVAGIMVRGSATNNDTKPPLVIVDGLPFYADISTIDTSRIVSMVLMKPDQAMAIYGSGASGGVLIITTRSKAAEAGFDEPMPATAIRRNFRDDAFWQPKLLTDAQGRASFTVTFPDDITSWRTFAIAMASKKRSGMEELFIKSFKALSGNIVLPQFAVEGDSINVIGKTLNYLPDSVRVRRIFSVNDKVYKENILRVRNAWIDTFSVVAAIAANQVSAADSVRKDSLKLKYTIQRENGYADGEERSVPVFKPGTFETNGVFAALNRDTSFAVSPKKENATVKVYAESSLLPVWYAEAESIRHYEYLCNEQLASKLKAMLVQKSIDEFYKRPFKGEKNILDLIRRLDLSKSKTGLWDWWKSDHPTMWISLHVLEALTEASKRGYIVNMNKPGIIDYLVFNLENFKGNEKLSSLFLLHLMDAKVDYKRYIDTIEKHALTVTQFEKLRMIELKQKLGLPVSLDTLIAKRGQTVFGNVYWGEENYLFFNNSVQITLAMYRILKKAGGYEDLLMRIRNYFLEKRKNGNWRNTYESSLILQTILPDLLVGDPVSNPATLTISGKENITVKDFPFYTELKTGESIEISKKGAMPVYFTAYEQYWNRSPEKVDGNFSVHSFFDGNGKSVSNLKAGQPVTLRVVVNVKSDAEYVMVEIPIPAGCSYQEKRQSWLYNEVHREHFKNKVSIFCKKLTKGRYEFSVSLLPRFTGSYTVNPAKAEMMYFPVFNGSEGMKRVRIE